MELLKMTNVYLTYQTIDCQTEALKNINLSINDGEFVAIVGPSGCGKTTILSLIAGLIPVSSGTIELDNKLVNGSNKDVGYMLQKDQLFQWRDIKSNIMLGLEIQKKKTKDNILYAENLLEKYGLNDFKHHHPNELSGGMRQRAALIRTLSFRPKLLLLDEPFSALDYQTRLNVCDDVHSIIKNEHKTAILVTHDISEAVSLADKIIVLTPRPAQIKNIYTIDLHSSPLKRREDSKFAIWFDTIWKDVTV